MARKLTMPDVEGFAIRGLATQDACDGNDGSAEQRYDNALAIFRAIPAHHFIAETLLTVGEFLHRLGRAEDARDRFEEARAVAEEFDFASIGVMAGAYLTDLGHADAGDVRDDLAANEDRLSADARMTARFLLWKAAGDPADLAEARRLLDYRVDHAPPEFRDSMVGNVPLDREIAAANPD